MTGFGIDLLPQDVRDVGQGLAAACESCGMDEAPAGGDVILGGTACGAAAVVAWTSAALFDEETLVDKSCPYTAGGSGLDVVGEVEHAALFERTGLAARAGLAPAAATGWISIDELAVLVEATEILRRVQDERSFGKSTVEVASLGFATLQMLLDHTIEA